MMPDANTLLWTTMMIYQSKIVSLKPAGHRVLLWESFYEARELADACHKAAKQEDKR